MNSIRVKSYVEWPEVWARTGPPPRPDLLAPGVIGYPIHEAIATVIESYEYVDELGHGKIGYRVQFAAQEDTTDVRSDISPGREVVMGMFTCKARVVKIHDMPAEQPINFYGDKLDLPFKMDVEITGVKENVSGDFIPVSLDASMCLGENNETLIHLTREVKSALHMLEIHDTIEFRNCPLFCPSSKLLTREQFENRTYPQKIKDISEQIGKVGHGIFGTIKKSKDVRFCQCFLRYLWHRLQSKRVVKIKRYIFHERWTFSKWKALLRKTPVVILTLLTLAGIGIPTIWRWFTNLISE